MRSLRHGENGLRIPVNHEGLVVERRAVTLTDANREHLQKPAFKLVRKFRMCFNPIDQDDVVCFGRKSIDQ